MRHLKFLIMLLCGEWLLLFRAWVAPGVLFQFVLAAVIRFVGYGVLPHRMGITVFLFALPLALIMHLRSMFRTRSREMFGTPDTGVPWLVIVARNPKLAQFLEFGIVVAFIIYLQETPMDNRIITEIPPAIANWVMSRPVAIANEYAGLALFGLLLWNAIHGAQKVPEKGPQALKYNPVRQQSHSTPKLPNIKEMMDELES